jgi:hypothetical protein
MTKRREITLSLFYGMFILLLPLYREAFPAELDLTSTTHLQEYEDPRDNNFLTLRQYLDFNVIGYNDRLSLYSNGWFRLELDDTENGDRSNDELLYAYLSYRPLADHTLVFNLGRHFVYEGLASEQIDGVSARWEILPMLGVSAYAGVPLEPDFDDRESDYIFGGRLFLRLAQRAEVGLAYLQEDNDGSSYREEMGVDVWLRPLHWLELRGESRRNQRTHDWSEHAYSLNVFPVEKLTLSTFVAYTDYDAAFSTTTLSAFLPQFVGVGEELTKIGLSAEYAWNAWLSTVADYTRYAYDIQGRAHFFGLALRAYVIDHDLAAGASIHRMDGHTKRLRYLKARLYVTKTFKALEVSLDTVHLNYDESFNGTNHAYAFSGSLAYKLTDSLLLSTSVYYSKNPDFDQEVRTFFKIVYTFEKEI